MHETFLDIGLMVALAACAVGVAVRIGRWSRIPAEDASPSAVSGRSFFKAAKAVVVDILLLGRTFRTSPVRWLAHCLVFIGFTGLLLFHALDGTITVALFPAYEPTLDPWQFLRNLFGVMTLAGLGLMVYRRVADRRVRAVTRTQDWAALLVVAGIILSGFLLEAAKIMSPAPFDRMVREYALYDNGRELTALKAYWAHEYGSVFPERLPMDAETLEMGASLNEDSCVDCHSDTSSAFVSRPLATVLMPLAPAMSRSGADEVFWYLHIILCLAGLAALPLGKFLHPLSTPANMIARQGRRDGVAEPAPSMRGLGLDACTRCGECSLRCSVAPAFTVLGNADILPSEKLASLQHFWGGDTLTDSELEAFAEGSRICTECLRCTDVCSAGINLQDLWMRSKPEVAAVAPDPNRAIRRMKAKEWVAGFGTPDPPPAIKGLADDAESFHACVQCTTCTSVCPVVAVSQDPPGELDLLPQQIMNLLRMGLKDQTLGARMVWSCTTCYKCQEHCPQGIHVADILYELRNTVAARKRGRRQA